MDEIMTQRPPASLSPILGIGIFVIVTPYIMTALGFTAFKWIGWIGGAMLVVGIIHSFMLTLAE